ncbi:MAG: HAMP domain-containing sensor histidine kinase [Betaproteobacteria bacterium]
MNTQDLAPYTGDLLYENAACGLLVTESDGTIRRVNATFAEWIGYRADELVGTRRFQDLLTVGGRVFHQTHWQPLLQIQGSVAEVKLDIVRQNGERIPVLLNAVRRPHGERIFHELAVFVATDRHKYELELLNARRQLDTLNGRLSDADRRKDEFLATLAHELRNPLAPVRNVLHILREKNVGAQQVEWGLGILDRQVRHLSRLVDDLLDVSRIKQGKIDVRKKHLDLVVLLRECADEARPLMESAGHEFTVRLPEESIIVDGDETRLAQIVQNLCNNAAKFTPRGGKVMLSAERSGRHAAVRVRDSGIGISPASIHTIFDMFLQVDNARDRSPDGLGIGLALVRALVELHGGTITAESSGTGTGAEFTVQLPCVPQHTD